MNTEVNVYGIISIILDIVSIFLFGWILSGLGFVFGIVGLVTAGDYHEKITPIIGLILGIVLFVITMCACGLASCAVLSVL